MKRFARTVRDDGGAEVRPKPRVENQAGENEGVADQALKPKLELQCLTKLSN